jgi:hypothetical protein
MKRAKLANISGTMKTAPVVAIAIRRVSPETLHRRRTIIGDIPW